MPQIKSSSLVLAAMLLILVMTLFGCGDKNSQAVLEPSTGEHPANWMPVGHKTAASANILSCTACHGEDYLGGISKISCTNQSGINGIICHATSPAANLSGCISCHGGLTTGPTGSVGSSAPNRNFAHDRHTALLTGCATCHLNAGSSTTNHARSTASGGISAATVTFDTFVNTASTAIYNAGNGTCSNVSCHGGQLTPAWTTTPQLDLVIAGNNSSCLTCHTKGTAAGAPQYNSFYSGVSIANAIPNLHTFHIEVQLANCTDCHNIGKLNNDQLHFGGIATKSLTFPERTIGNDNPAQLPTITGPTKIDSYTTSTKTCVNVACHPAHFPAQWIH